MLALSAHLADRGSEEISEAQSPWNRRQGWRLNLPAEERLLIDAGAGEQTIVLSITTATIDGVALPMGIVPSGTVHDLGQGQHLVLDETGAALVRIIDPLARSGVAETAAGGVVAPMPGKVTRVHVAVGDVVTRGAPLLVVEAMKMEHTLNAPSAGTVTVLNGTVGAFVTEGTVLVEIE